MPVAPVGWGGPVCRVVTTFEAARGEVSEGPAEVPASLQSSPLQDIPGTQGAFLEEPTLWEEASVHDGSVSWVFLELRRQCGVSHEI